ncbi:MAG: hypothetical protein EPN22_03465 [Nitrospirae bacterium]|nr:MAG: hypothetical protein EPN22_03465 [Nitrospirota bacterium]
MHLGSSDMTALLEAIRRFYTYTDVNLFPFQIQSELVKLISCDLSTYNEIKPLEQKASNITIPYAVPEEQMSVFRRSMHEHPYINLLNPALPHPFKDDIREKARKRHPGYIGSPEGRAVMISDVLTQKQFHRLVLYNEFYRGHEIEYQLLVNLANQPSFVAGLTFNRSRRDFSERDRLMLNLLCPHILQAFRNARLLSKIKFDTSSLEPEPGGLTSLGLTSREAEVLGWVAYGKTNADIAVICGMSVETVKKHLYRIYSKLGVENRVAAAMCAMNVLKRQAPPETSAL